MPDNMQGKDNFDEMRKSKRIEYYSNSLCTKYFYDGKEIELDMPIDIMLINVSASGLGIICKQKFEDTTILTLKLTLEDSVYEAVSAKVIWGMKKGDMYRYGLQICRLSGKLFSHLSKLDNSVITHA